MNLEAFIAETTTPAAPPLVPEIRLRLAEEITPLWEAIEAASGRTNTPPPFWAFPWVGGQGLARHVLDHPELVRGRAALDFGAGSGLVAIAAAKAGARRVVAVDVDPLAGAAAAANAALNDVALEVAVEDVVGRELPEIDVFLVGDMCYEQPLAGRLLSWLRGRVRAGKLVLVGEPGRNYAPRGGVRELARFVAPTTYELESRTSRETAVLELLGEEA